MDRPRLGSSRRWSPPPMSPRFERLPSLSDYSQPPSSATYAPRHWEAPPSPRPLPPAYPKGSPPPRPKPKTETDGNTVTLRSKDPEQIAMPTAISGRVHKLERIVNAILNCVDGLENSSALAEWRQTYQQAASPPGVHANLEVPVSASPATSGGTAALSGALGCETRYIRPKPEGDLAAITMDLHESGGRAVSMKRHRGC
ncbi:hypothetical protein CspeluHIS016_0702750 [Cutaneotrichosporon spelunceum]|uniref:Uncharacterized protein n=1 Tax=Cutaneotrichosporon spelunceum TaxID=1672016 RepID=A0AAD3TZC6_9TREE|nr:hypothetical protein CspeluHIS016_0702750 [Cutaneotrichosporon spelunceum]